MNNLNYTLLTTLALFWMIFLTRALPFLFSRILKNNATLTAIGEYLPAYIMMLLVIYEVGLSSFVHYPYGIPAVMALGVLVLAHLWKRQLLLSILTGTVVYAFMNYLMH